MTHDIKRLKMASQTIHAGQYPDPTTGAVAPPIFQTSTFAFDNCAQGANRFLGKEKGFIYTRMGNPTINRLEEAVATLEKGADGLAVASGMAALNTVLFALLKSGDHIIGTQGVYGPSRMVIERDWSRFGIDYSFVDTSDLSTVKAAIRPETKLIFVETPANPTVVLSDIGAISKIAKENNAMLMVDNTFASPILQRPIEHGADIVMHSMTKFINGATDVVSGMIVPATEELVAKIRPADNYLGACMDPHQAWLVLRGFKTLSLRVNAAQANAQKVAQYLYEHPKVEKVMYPGLKSHPQYDLAQRQMDGSGSLISFEISGGVEAGSRLLNNVDVMTLAVSLGGIETLIQHPASMTHAAIPPDARIAAGIADGLVRVSVGCEDIDDLLKDFEQALGHV
jgi:methionine-gamma-lyase